MRTPSIAPPLRMRLEESRVVVRGGSQPGASREALPRTVHVIALALRAFGARTKVPSGPLAYTAARRSRSAGGNEEARVLQSQRAGDARADELVERHARGLLHHAAEDVGVVAVDERLAGLRDERQRAQTLHGLADGFVFVGRIPAVARGRAEAFAVRTATATCGSVP